MKYILFTDTETTGLPEEQSGNILIQLAFAIYDVATNEFILSSENFNKPENKLTSKAMSMHHITPEMLEDADSLEETMTFQLMKSFVTNHKSDVVVCAHNLNFDFNVISRVMDLSDVRQLDTLKIARMINDQTGLHWENCQLQYLKYELGLYQQVSKIKVALGIEKELSAHDAMSDIIDLILLFSYFQGKYNASVEQMVNITEGDPLFLKHMPSGKDKGMLMTALSYNQLKWHAENSYDENVKFTCRKLLS